MENTSKALLIVAAVLITIIIVAVSIKILSAANNVADSSNKIGKDVSIKSDEASKKVLNILDNLGNKNLVNIPDLEIEIDYWYYEYFPQNPKVLLEPSTEYILSFDYKINYAENDDIGCGIGYGEDIYKTSIHSKIEYPNLTEGTFVKIFKTPDTFDTDKPYLHLRFVRTYQPGKFSVQISNIKFKKTE